MKLRSKNIAKSVVILVIFVLGVVCFLHGSNSRPVAAKMGGAEVYQAQCASCHGGDGKANTVKGKRKRATDLTKSKISTAQGIKVITNGRELMPAFGNTLSESEISEVMSYIRGFRQ